LGELRERVSVTYSVGYYSEDGKEYLCSALRVGIKANHASAYMHGLIFYLRLISQSDLDTHVKRPLRSDTVSLTRYSRMGRQAL
jgi:hypothetical protein